MATPEETLSYSDYSPNFTCSVNMGIHNGLWLLLQATDGAIERIWPLIRKKDFDKPLSCGAKAAFRDTLNSMCPAGEIPGGDSYRSAENTLSVSLEHNFRTLVSSRTKELLCEGVLHSGRHVHVDLSMHKLWLVAALAQALCEAEMSSGLIHIPARHRHPTQNTTTLEEAICFLCAQLSSTGERMDVSSIQQAVTCMSGYSGRHDDNDHHPCPLSL